MGKYTKLWAAVAGTIGIGLIQFGIVDAGQWAAISTSIVSVLSAFGVYQFTNKA